VSAISWRARHGCNGTRRSQCAGARSDDYGGTLKYDDWNAPGQVTSLTSLCTTTALECNPSNRYAVAGPASSR
jgi:hypothetical protein